MPGVRHAEYVVPAEPQRPASSLAMSRGTEGARAETEPLGSVAIVHDYLNQPGGAERVVLAMAAIWPDAPIYTSLYRADSTFPGFGAANVQISGLRWLPIDRGFRNLFPLYPAAFRSFGPLEHDIVISSSSGWAHSVRTGP